MKIYSGIAAAPGISIGPIYQFRHVDLNVGRVSIENPHAEWHRLELALGAAKAQLVEVRSHARTQVEESDAAIFDAQATILEDPELLRLVREGLDRDRVNIENSWLEATEHYATLLEGMSSEYLRARAADLRDVAQRVLRLLLGVEDTGAAGLKQPSIIFAPDLTPSDTVHFDQALVLGFCTASGGLTSHTAILARSLGLPAVVGAGKSVTALSGRDVAILDGTHGQVLAHPTAEAIEEYGRRREREIATRNAVTGESRAPAITRDGRRVEVVANIGSVAGAKKAIALGAEGVGLLRTEFLYLERGSIPDEQEQYVAYKAILDDFGDLPVVMRTLDIGGDKELPYLNIEREMNPFLGVRGIRLCMARPDLFKPQLRAALRAGAGHKLKLMFPMVAVPAEVRAARATLEECRQELIAEHKQVPHNLEVGIMVEVPSAALMAGSLAQDVDFFSIGTNDLTQYTLAADRTNAALAHLSSAFSPAVLRLIRSVIGAAHDQGKWAGLCGELAGEPLAIPILLGLGLDEFSMSPPSIPTAKALIRSLFTESCRSLAARALELETADEVMALARQHMPLEGAHRIAAA